MSDSIPTSYDEVPYDCKAIFATHPDCLGTVAHLMGLKPAPLEQCRVLELGCGNGANIIPMALTLPRSQFVGVDLSSRQVADGHETLRTLGIGNIELHPLSILEFGESFGLFDYILCHGVYSWVPPQVQDKILSICKANLAPHGVAYVSYNTYPGWHMRGLIREVLGYHVQQFDDPSQRIQQARAFLKFLAKATPMPDGSYGKLLEEEIHSLKDSSDSYIFHEHLEDINDPVYFHQFMARATDKGLQYLGESVYHTRFDNLAADVQETLQGLASNLLMLEQYLDFVRNRRFRRTLLCHVEAPLDRAVAMDRIEVLYVSAVARPVSDNPDLFSTAVETFEADDGNTASSNHPLVKTAFQTLYEAWPRAVPFPALWERVRDRLAASSQVSQEILDKGREALGRAMVRCYLSNMAGFHLAPWTFSLDVTPRPHASPLALLQAQTGARITNLRHRPVVLSDFDRAVLCHLDGRHDRAALVDALATLAGAGDLKIEKDGQPVQDPETRRTILTEALDPSLQRLARSCLLVS